MTASRRQFTFGALMLALAGEARASGAQQAVPAPKLSGRYEARRRGDELLVDLVLVNEGPAADVVVAWGSRHGPALHAAIEVAGERVELAPIFDVDRREIVSRMGPRPRFAPVAEGGELRVGPYRFAWVPGVPDLPVSIGGVVETSDGDVALPEVVAWKPAET